MRPAEGDYYTQPKIETETFIEETREERDALGVALRFGVVSVMEEVVAFQRKRMSDHEVIDLQTLDLPEQNFVTQALWYELPKSMVGELPLQALLGRPARGRALADRRPAADRDVRPLGHRRPVHQLSTTRPAAPRSSSTTAIPAASGSRAAASTSSSGWSATRAG